MIEKFQLLRRLRHDERGAAMVEYGLLVALIALAAAVGAGALGTELNVMFNSISTTLANSLPG